VVRINLEHPNIRRLFSMVASFIIRLLGVTWRVEWSGLENIELARRMSNQVVFAFWHGRLLVLSYSHRNRKIQVLASEHPDGDLMGKTITNLGFGHLKGSTSRGGARAIRKLSSVLKDGFDVGLTVDGPRGPRGVVQQGAVEISRLTGSAIVPITNTAKPRMLFKSWDRFQLPLPFARIAISYGQPFVVPNNCGRKEREELRMKLQDELKGLTTGLDRDFGYTGSDVWPHESN
jgi:lysophospholipid acyltransferase (LPLAT)-like uncharacterized protein